MHHPDNGQRSYKPRTYLWVCGSWGTDRRKSRISSSFFLLSHTKLLTSIAYKLKQILSYFMHRTTLLSSQQPLSPSLSANWQEWRFWLAAVPRSCNTMPFWTTNKVKVQTCTYCACAVHMLTCFNTLCLKWWLHSSCLLNPCQSDIWLFTTTKRNSYQPVLVCIYRNCAIVEVWLPFMMCRTCILKTLTCQADVFCSWYMQIVEPLQSLQARPTWLSWSSLINALPPSPLRWWWLSLIITPTLYIEWHIIINGNRKKHQSLLLKGLGSGPGPSSPPSCFLSWHGD